MHRFLKFYTEVTQTWNSERSQDHIKPGPKNHFLSGGGECSELHAGRGKPTAVATFSQAPWEPWHQPAAATAPFP